MAYRLLSYLENSMPVLLATDTSTDMGEIAEREGIGLWCESGDIEKFTSNMDKMSASDLHEVGKRGYQFLLHNYTVDKAADNIIK